MSQYALGVDWLLDADFAKPQALVDCDFWVDLGNLFLTQIFSGFVVAGLANDSGLGFVHLLNERGPLP